MTSYETPFRIINNYIKIKIEKIIRFSSLKVPETLYITGL